jgi:hypothetical protein
MADPALFTFGNVDDRGRLTDYDEETAEALRLLDLTRHKVVDSVEVFGGALSAGSGAATGGSSQAELEVEQQSLSAADAAQRVDYSAFDELAEDDESELAVIGERAVAASARRGADADEDYDTAPAQSADKQQQQQQAAATAAAAAQQQQQQQQQQAAALWTRLVVPPPPQEMPVLVNGAAAFIDFGSTVDPADTVRREFREARCQGAPTTTSRAGASA